MGSVWNEEVHGALAIGAQRAGQASISEAAPMREVERLDRDRRLRQNASIYAMRRATVMELVRLMASDDSDCSGLDALVAELDAMVSKEIAQPGSVPTMAS